MSSSSTSMTDPDSAPKHDEIARAAHALWMEAGQPQGLDDQFWLQAEYQLRPPGHDPDVTATVLATLSQTVTPRK